MASQAELNRKYFDQLAHSREYETTFAAGLKQLHQAVLDQRHWIDSKWADPEGIKDQEIRMLEYACGPGIVSRALEPFVTKVVGIDVSDNMVAEFNNAAREAGVPPEKMLALQGDLLRETIPEDLMKPELFDFDIVVISMALHHFASPELALQRLGSRLKEGGVLLVIDIVSFTQGVHRFQHHPDAAATVTKDGFTNDEVHKLYEDASVDANFNQVVLKEPLEFTKGGYTYKPIVFMARGERV